MKAPAGPVPHATSNRRRIGSRAAALRLLASTHDAVFTLSRNGTVKSVAGGRHFGAWTKGWAGRSLRDLTHLDDWPDVRAGLRRALTGEISVFRARFSSPRGEARLLEVALVVEKRGTAVASLMGAVRDVAGGSRAEPRPERVASQLARIQEITHLGSWQWDPAEPAIAWSDELYRIYGLRPRECPINFEQSLEWIHPEDRDRMRGEVGRALDTGRAFAFEHRIVRPDGSIRILESRGEVIRDVAGRIVRLVGTSQDLTERREHEDARREAESRLRQLVESVQAILWRADVVIPQFTFVSREAQALLGYPVERWLQEPGFWIDHVHPEDREWVASFRARATQEKRDHEMEYRMIGAGSDVVWLRDVVRVVEQDGEARELVGVMIDITESRKASDELRRSGEQFQDLSAHLEWVREQERAAISREIHDELGQALTALKMDLSWLGRRLSGETGQPPREKLLERIASMSQIADGTLNRVRRISSELRPGLLDDLGLPAAIEWQTREFEARAGVRCEFRSEVTEERLDRELATAMFRILQETLTNVARHANASRVEVELTQHADRLMLAVRDDGNGIPAEGPGRAHSMGLMGMKERARRLGGLLTVAGRPGKGTEVVVAVPLAEAVSEADTR